MNYNKTIEYPANKLKITGQKFGMLTAIRPTEKRFRTYVVWEFLCDCGNTAYLPAGKVKFGKIKSCGCLVKKKHELTGKKYGYLTVIKKCEELRNSNIVWLCQCECGNFVEDTGGAIVSGNRTSCGCMQKMGLAKGWELNKNYNGTKISQIKSKSIWSTNKSGIRGVCFDKKKNKWRAHIVFQRKSYWLGLYDTIEEAAKARKLGEEKYHQPIIEEYEKMIAEEPIVETNLTEEEKAIILKGREEYAKGTYMPLSEI